MRFAHLADCHLGGWRHPELQKLNFESFQSALSTSLKEKVDFILIAGDLFDSAYPSIDTIKETFNEFRKLKEANIPVFLIAGSHDYSVSGKSFLDVLEKAGFAKNVFQIEERDDKIILQPTIHKNIAIYGYPGKKSGLEIQDLERMKIQDAPGLFKILMLHTTMKDSIGTLPIPSVDPSTIPDVDYVALGHIHINYQKGNRVYSGPTFPNNSAEMESLQAGSFYIVDTTGKIERREIKLKEFSSIDIEITDGLSGTEIILEELKKQNLNDKIFLLKVRGILERGKTSDIDFAKIETFAREQGVYAFLRNTSKLTTPNREIKLELKSSNMEEEIISNFEEKHPHKFNNLIEQLINSLQIEKKEDETSRVFEDRLISEVHKIIFK